VRKKVISGGGREMFDRINGQCRICHSNDILVRNIDLYVTGSEGLWACENCERKICEFIRMLQSVASTATRAVFLRSKNLEEKKK
jgi:hypothetical protein